jgi:glycosyltransferase involved in cell wall biosynthesis
VARDEDELLIIEDGSTDKSLEIMKAFAKRDSRIRVLDGEGKGLVHGLNLGLVAAKHGIIARADVDDYYSIERIAKQSQSLNSDVVAVFSDYRFRGRKGINLGLIPSPITPSASIFSLFSSQRTAHPSVMFRREAVIRAGGYLENDFPAEDLALWIRLTKFGQIVSCPDELLQYTLAASSISVTKRQAMLAKKKELLSQFKLSDSQVIEIKSELPKTLSTYNEKSHSTARKMLLYRDIKIAQTYLEFNDELRECELYLKNVLMKDPRLPAIFMKYSSQKIMRWIYRKNL